VNTDQKACPCCAETIKAASIRCWYDRFGPISAAHLSTTANAPPLHTRIGIRLPGPQ
jgi:hypothetical protein